MNYQPDEIARSLLRKQSNILGLIIPNVSHPFFSQLADRVMQRDRFNCRATHVTMAVSAAPLLRSGSMYTTGDHSMGPLPLPSVILTLVLNNAESLLTLNDGYAGSASSFIVSSNKFSCAWLVNFHPKTMTAICLVRLHDCTVGPWRHRPA
ncbi:hypothetical protein D3C81_265860 [compost metagenome]